MNLVQGSRELIGVFGIYLFLSRVLLNYEVFSLERDWGERKTPSNYATFKVFKKAQLI